MFGNSDLFRFRFKEAPAFVAVLLAGLAVGAILDNRDSVRLQAFQQLQANFVGVQTLQAINERLTRKALMLSRLTAAAQVLPELDKVTFEQIATGIALAQFALAMHSLMRYNGT